LAWLDPHHKVSKEHQLAVVGALSEEEPGNRLPAHISSFQIVIVAYVFLSPRTDVQPYHLYLFRISE